MANAARPVKGMEKVAQESFLALTPAEAAYFATTKKTPTRFSWSIFRKLRKLLVVT
jgi:hypothetical protein